MVQNLRHFENYTGAAFTQRPHNSGLLEIVARIEDNVILNSLVNPKSQQSRPTQELRIFTCRALV